MSNYPSIEYVLKIFTNKNLYILELEEGKYYVGKKTSNSNRRFMVHNGTEVVDKKYTTTWINKYPPLLDITPIEYFNCSDFDEDMLTKMLMCKYGIDNVRGGSYSQPILGIQEKQELERILPMECDRHAVKRIINCNIWLLELECDKYFVLQLEKSKKFYEFIKNSQIEWINRYPYKKTLGVIHKCTCLHADKYVIATMGVYGINNVRGGNYSDVNLSSIQRTSLHKALETAYDVCYICHTYGHFAKHCSHIKK